MISNVSQGLIQLVGNLLSPVQIKAGVEVPRLQIAAAINRSLIGHLDNPGAYGTLVGVKDGRFAVDKQKDVLQEIICLRGIAQDAKRNSTYKSRIAAKQESQRFPALLADTNHQAFVGKLA